MKQLVLMLALATASPAFGQGRVYRVELTQQLEIQSAGDVHEALRELSYVLTISDLKPRGDSMTAVLRFDSIRGAMNTPHGRELMDLRPLNGTRLAAVWPRQGGTPRFEQPVPTADYAMGGEMTLAEPLSYLFTPMPAAPPRPGLAWSGAFRRVSVEGNTSTERAPAARFTLTRLERGVARIEFSGSDGPTSGQGALGLSGHALVDLADASAREVTVREEATGRYAFGAEQLPYRQTNTITLVRR